MVFKTVHVNILGRARVRVDQHSRHRKWGAIWLLSTERLGADFAHSPLTGTDEL